MCTLSHLSTRMLHALKRLFNFTLTQPSRPGSGFIRYLLLHVSIVLNFSSMQSHNSYGDKASHILTSFNKKEMQRWFVLPVPLYIHHMTPYWNMKLVTHSKFLCHVLETET